MARVIVEVLVEDPESPRDAEVLKTVREATAGLEGVEVRLFLYGGPHEYPYSCGILKAYKTYTIPAIVVNGELAFGPEVPSARELRDYLERALAEGSRRCGGSSGATARMQG